MSNITNNIVTRFAPSPTGFLHIGGARTALFNWLYARHHGGKFLLRIEDTDKTRSTQAAKNAIIDGLQWLGLLHDDEIIYQSHNIRRHQDIAMQLLKEDKAYYCYCSPEELQIMREDSLKLGKTVGYNGKWRDPKGLSVPENINPVVRIKSPEIGTTSIHDNVQGNITINNNTIDDFVILRGDKTPTYMLSVVVDDYDMGVTSIIRGDDHLTNAFRQKIIYDSLGWGMPSTAHIPLIHGSDGAKLSKRHGALGLEHYKGAGILPEALCNYFLRLGWSHGNDEFISIKQAIEWFTLESIGKSPARFDSNKLMHMNAYYLRNCDNQELYEKIAKTLQEIMKRNITSIEESRIVSGLSGLKERSQTLLDLANQSVIYMDLSEINFDEKAKKFIISENYILFEAIREKVNNIDDWTEKSIESLFRIMSDERQIKLGKLAQPMRAVLTGTTISPSIFEIMFILGKAEVLKRVNWALKRCDP